MWITIEVGLSHLTLEEAGRHGLVMVNQDSNSQLKEGTHVHLFQPVLTIWFGHKYTCTYMYLLKKYKIYNLNNHVDKAMQIEFPNWLFHDMFMSKTIGFNEQEKMTGSGGGGARQQGHAPETQEIIHAGHDRV